MSKAVTAVNIASVQQVLSWNVCLERNAIERQALAKIGRTSSAENGS